MKIELTLDNGVHYLLQIPFELFNFNTKKFLIETFTKWINDEAKNGGK